MISKPATVGDVEVLLAEAVPNYQDMVTVVEEKGAVHLRPKRYLLHEERDAIHDAVRRMGGSYRARHRDFIVPLTPPAQPAEAEFDVVPIESLLFPVFKSRLDPGESIDELAESIKQQGLLEPVLVRPKPSGLLEIVAGERRVKAARKAGLIEVPVISRPMTDQEAMEVQLVENLQRKDLSDYEKARWLQEMIKRFGYTQEELGKKIGKSQVWVSRHLRILDIESDPNIPRGIKPQDLTEYQARVLLSASPEKRREITAKIEAEGEVPSARKIESMVAEDASTSEAAPGPETTTLETSPIIEEKEVPATIAASVEQTITGVIGVDLDEIRKLLVDEHGLTEQDADTALQGFKEAYPDIWDICYDDQDKPKLPHVPVTLEERSKDEEDVQKYIEEHDLGWILRIPPTDVNYKSHLPKLTDEELDFCLIHETRSTSLQRLRGEKVRRERAQQEQEIDQAVFTCNRCGKSFLIVHLEPSGRHKLKPVKEAEQ